MNNLNTISCLLHWILGRSDFWETKVVFLFNLILLFNQKICTHKTSIKPFWSLGWGGMSSLIFSRLKMQRNSKIKNFCLPIALWRKRKLFAKNKKSFLMKKRVIALCKRSLLLWVIFRQDKEFNTHFIVSLFKEYYIDVFGPSYRIE